MARICDKIYDNTSTVGAALDTGAINVTQYDSITVWYVANGGTPTAVTASLVDTATSMTTYIQIATTTPGSLSQLAWAWCVGGGIAAPPPQYVRFNASLIVSQTVRLIIYGARNNPI